MKRIFNAICMMSLMLIIFQMTACSTNSTASDFVTNAPENDQVAIFFVVADANSIMDDEVISFSVMCNHYSAVDGSNMNIKVMSSLGNVLYETNENFISGNSYSYTLTPEDCGLVFYDSGDCTISVSSTYNSYVGTAVVDIQQYPENTIDVALGDTVGTIDNKDYVNEFFGIKMECPNGFVTYDTSYFSAESFGGYTVDYNIYSVAGYLDVYAFVGHIHYETEVDVEDLIEFNTFSAEPESTEIVTINDIEFLTFDSQDAIYYMTVKDSEILVFALYYYGEGDPEIQLITDSIQPI